MTRIRITCHPIYRKFQERLCIYNDSVVQSISTGRILKLIYEAGYTNMHVDTQHEGEIRIHCKKELNE